MALPTLTSQIPFSRGTTVSLQDEHPFRLAADVDERISEILSAHLPNSLADLVNCYTDTTLYLPNFEQRISLDEDINDNLTRLSTLKISKIVFPNRQLKSKTILSLIKLVECVTFDFGYSQTCLKTFLVTLCSHACPKYVKFIHRHIYTLKNNPHADHTKVNGYAGSKWDDVQHEGGLYVDRGFRYNGMWSYGSFHGCGVLVFFKGNVCEIISSGEWRECAREGQGIKIYEDGSQYDGKWHRGLRHGHGTMTYQDGSHHEGEWLEDHPYGPGVWIDPAGNRREVIWC